MDDTEAHALVQCLQYPSKLIRKSTARSTTLDNELRRLSDFGGSFPGTDRTDYRNWFGAAVAVHAFDMCIS